MIYRIVNLVVLTIAFLIFCNTDLSVNRIITQYPKGVVLVFVFSVMIVHIIKSGRLWLALYGNKINGKEYLKTYCKVTPVNIILPFKIGELYRIYCYGYLLKDYLKSTIVILLDRFMDTIALITLLLLLCFFNNSKIRAFVYLLILFMLVLFILYNIFPNFYKFWKIYFLDAKATKNKLQGLKYLEKINNIYMEIRGIIEGRGIILYSLSVLAWAIEIFNLIMLNKLFFNKLLNNIITKYLNSAIGSSISVEFSSFVFISVIILLMIYVVLRTIQIFEKKV